MQHEPPAGASLLLTVGWRVGRDSLGTPEGARGFSEQAEVLGEAEERGERGRQQLLPPPKGQAQKQSVRKGGRMRQERNEAMHGEAANVASPTVRKLPSEGASAVQVAAFVSSMPMDHQDEWCRAFFFAFHAEDAQGPSAWPKAIPFPEVLRSRPRTELNAWCPYRWW